MALKPKIYKDKLITKYVDNESAALHDNVQISHERVTKVKAGAGLFDVIDSRPNTTSEFQPSAHASRTGPRHRKTPSKTFNLIDNMMDATQANAQISEFLQNYMATNNFDENLFLEKEQYISDYFKEKFRLMGIFLGENILSELLHKAKNRDQKGFNDQVNGIINGSNSPRNTDRKFTLTLSSDEGAITTKKTKGVSISKRTDTEISRKGWAEIDKNILSEHEQERYEEFKEKFKNMGILLGDNILNPLKDTKKKKFLDDLDDEKKKELQTFAFSDGNEEIALKDHALTKVLKINKDIIQQILREEHENKIKKLEQLQVEQNMQVFNALSENPKLTIVNETVKKRSLSPKEKVQKLPKVIVKTNFLREELFEEDEDLQDLDIFYKSPAEMNDHIHEVIQKKLSDGNVDMNKPKTALAVNTSSKSMSMPAQNPRPNTVGFKFRFGKLDFTDKIVNALDTHKFNNEDGNIKSPQMKKLAISSFNSPMHELVSSKSDHKLDLGSPTSQFAQHHFMMPQTTTSATKIHSMELKPDMLLSESINFLKFEKDRVFQDFKAKFKQPPKTSDAKMRTKKTIYSKPRAEDLPSPIHAEMITSGDFFENLHKFDDLEDDIFEEQTKKEKPLFPKVLYPRKPIKPSTAAPAAGVAYYQNQSPRGQNKGSSRALIKVNRLQPTGAINNNGQNTYITSQDPLAPTSLGYFKPKSGNFYTRMHQNLVNKEAMFEEIKKNEQYKTHLRTVDPNPLSGLMIQAGVAHLQANTTKNDKKNKFSLTAGAGNFWKNNS